MFKIRLKKNFWRKMVITNCLFLILVVAIFTAIRYQTSITAAKKATEDILIQYADTNTNQLQLIFDEMSRLTRNIAVATMTTDILRESNNYQGSNNYFEIAQSQRRELMNMIQQMFGPQLAQNSINVISAQGDYILLDIYPSQQLSREKVQAISMLEDFQGENAYKFIKRTEQDAFGRIKEPTFSYVRKISDEYNVLGYVEYQKPCSDLDSIFQNGAETFHMISIVTLNDTVFYLSNPNFSNLDSLISSAEPEGSAVTTVQLDQEAYLMHPTSVPAYGFKIYTLLPKSYYTQQATQEMILLITQSTLLLFSMLFLILLISKQIYKPVRDLRHKMENMELDNLKTDIQLSGSADEIELFNHVFAEMLERIQHQKDELLQQKIRELQVSYRALQAQVSPHFLYNTLYLIGLKGEEHEVPEILDMCSCLTHMMGYCVDLKHDLVPISRELEYMKNYLTLMKYRYLDKLQYELDIADSVTERLVPKFILQPLIENCFTHGFKNCRAEKFLILFSLKQNEDTWTLKIEDNGIGFSDEDKARVLKDIELVQQSIKNPNVQFVNQITGIGLINTYARLFITYSTQVTIKIGISNLSGGLVEITCPISMEQTNSWPDALIPKEK